MSEVFTAGRGRHMRESEEEIVARILCDETADGVEQSRVNDSETEDDGLTQSGNNVFGWDEANDPQTDPENLKLRRRTTRELLEEMPLIISDEVYFDYCHQMKEERLRPFGRKALVQFNVHRVFGNTGLLSQSMEGYRQRPGQLDFVNLVTNSADVNGQIMMVEAGTGTGKTFAYLIPLLLAGRRIMISTGTKALQDQLIAKDIPNLIRMLNLPQVTFMALKGRTNYLCRCKCDQLQRRLLDGTGKGAGVSGGAGTGGVSPWSQQGRSYGQKITVDDAETGDKQIRESDIRRVVGYVRDCVDELRFDKEHASFGEINFNLSAELRAAVTCDSFECESLCEKSHKYVNPEGEMCSGCPYASPLNGPEKLCFIKAARKEAAKRTIVVINHALYLSGNEYFLPPVDRLVLDEAHVFPDVLASVYTRKFSALSLGQFMEDADKLKSELQNNPDFTDKLQDEFDLGLDLIDNASQVLKAGMELMVPGYYNVLDFKYRHQSDLSPFQMLGDKLIPEKIQNNLRPESCLYKWLHDYMEQTLNQAEDDDRKSQILAPMGDVREQNRKTYARWVKDHATIIEQAKDAHAAPLEDVLCDSKGLVQEPLFCNILRDLYLGVDKISSLLDKIAEALEANRAQQVSDDDDELESSEEDSGIGELKRFIITCEELKDGFRRLMITDRDKNGNPTWKDAAWFQILDKEQAQESLRRMKNKKHQQSQDADENVNPFILKVAPIDISEHAYRLFKGLCDSGGSVIMTSATITYNHKFGKLIHELGLGGSQVQTLMVDSPFDFKRNSCLMVSSTFPDTDDPERVEKSILKLEPVIYELDGGMFFLSTSKFAMTRAADVFTKKYQDERQIIVQGQGSVARLMSDFKDDGNAILVATSSFWEGVDVPGKALSMVVIDKLPFSSLGEPFEANRKYITEKIYGQSYFEKISLPEAIIKLKQGVGRLIRQETDTGALVILDPRLVSARYRHDIFNSLPKMSVVHDINDLVRFVISIRKP